MIGRYLRQLAAFGYPAHTHHHVTDVVVMNKVRFGAIEDPPNGSSTRQRLVKAVGRHGKYPVNPYALPILKFRFTLASSGNDIDPVAATYQFWCQQLDVCSYASRSRQEIVRHHTDG